MKSPGELMDNLRNPRKIKSKVVLVQFQHTLDIIYKWFKSCGM